MHPPITGDDEAEAVWTVRAHDPDAYALQAALRTDKRMMTYRMATINDLSLLAELNRQLIQDEGHRNPMTLSDLAERMGGWLAGEYTAILFEEGSEWVAYALYRPEADGVYLRQFFVSREHRRRGYGRQAMEILASEVWAPGLRVTLEVLVDNHRALDFWKRAGFNEYAMTFERTLDESPRIEE